MAAIWKFLISPLGRYLVGVLAIASACWWGYSAICNRCTSICEGRHETVRLKAVEEGTKQYLAAIDWGNQISSKLAETQRENAQLRSQHEQDSQRIIGSCPAGLRLLHDAAAGGYPLSEAARASLGSSSTAPASPIAEAISGNYAKARECRDQLNALIDWHTHKE